MKASSARISQLIFLALFLILFLAMEYRWSDDSAAAVGTYFHANPLASVSTMLATRSFELLLLPGLVVLFFTALLGRFFCGWLCPLGTVLDLVTGRIRKVGAIRALQGNVKYRLLLPLLFSSVFHFNISGLLDPIAILFRALTFFTHPTLGDHRDFLHQANGVVRDYVFPFQVTLSPLTFLSALMFFLILLLERYERRNWCRNLCPLGTLLGFVARYSRFSQLPTGTCYCCRGCTDGCPGGFSRDIFQSERCLRCMHCSITCSSGRARVAAARRERRR